MGCRLSKSISQGDLQDLCKDKPSIIRDNNVKKSHNGSNGYTDNSRHDTLLKNGKSDSFNCPLDALSLTSIDDGPERETHSSYQNNDSFDAKNVNFGNVPNNGLLNVVNSGNNDKSLSLIESASQIEFFRMLDEKIAQGGKNMPPELAENYTSDEESIRRYH
uniref:Uncharacterized protein n=1 Tax=Rhabditophanes sp. KR3021 TaxID=114890 RepID=A0AC35TMT2_9BILA